jgi:hypothetical protein
MVRAIPVGPEGGVDEVVSALGRDLQAMDDAMRFMMTDTHADILSTAASHKEPTIETLNVRGLAAPGSDEYIPD